MNTKKIGTLLIAGLVVLSAMVVFTTSVMADDVYEDVVEPEPNPDEDPVRFNGTLTIEGSPWANKWVKIYRWNEQLERWQSPCFPVGCKWKAQTNDTGYFQTKYSWWIPFLTDPTYSPWPNGTFGLVVSETGLPGSWTSLEARDLARTDFILDDTTGVCVDVYWWTYTWNYPIPEFSTIALPAVAVLGLFLYFNRRKQRKE